MLVYKPRTASKKVQSDVRVVSSFMEESYDDV